ncbi:myotubularin-related protein 9-like isoform X3 [Mobula hypostoma]|uniref:myotubularin-related protein 9-like isoform X3 n=1 Tax=Mobula hypostoma TaxID=723540 RepID=UPI002FC315F4
MELAERIRTSQVDDVVLSRPFLQPVKGTLCVSSHHLLLSSRTGDAAELWLLIRNIDAIEKSVQNLRGYQTIQCVDEPYGDRFSGSSGIITVKCKDLCVWFLEIPGMEECLNIASSIEALSSLESVTDTYPFFYRPKSLRLQQGWDLCPPEVQYDRLSAHTNNWRLSYVNKDFAVCSSYPDAVIVHRSINDAALKVVAKFRQGGRFPVLSYYHRKNGMVIMRSSQPLTGANGKRCKEDEDILAAVLPPGLAGYIIDTRSVQAAHQAKVKGGGWESKGNYPNWKRLHKPIDREEGCVLIHGSEGRDTVLQLTSLAQVILDPDCRTIGGFQALIEREWLQAGHPFQLRCASSAYSHAKPKHEAPVFLIFLDCCWQLSTQFPCSFQFNQHFLVTLFEHAYASRFGSFLCNSEEERSLLKVKERTISLWPWINSPGEREKYLNPLYERNSLTIWPSVAPQSLQLWNGLFLRWKQSSEHHIEAWEQISHIMRHGRRESIPTAAKENQVGNEESAQVTG